MTSSVSPVYYSSSVMKILAIRAKNLLCLFIYFFIHYSLFNKKLAKTLKMLQSRETILHLNTDKLSDFRGSGASFTIKTKKKTSNVGLIDMILSLNIYDMQIHNQHAEEHK